MRKNCWNGQDRNEQKRRAFNRIMVKTKQKKPICTKNGVVWGTDRDTLK